MPAVSSLHHFSSKGSQGEEPLGGGGGGAWGVKVRRQVTLQTTFEDIFVSEACIILSDLPLPVLHSRSLF